MGRSDLRMEKNEETKVKCIINEFEMLSMKLSLDKK